jgi:hypothetical protein
MPRWIPLTAVVLALASVGLVYQRLQVQAQPAQPVPGAASLSAIAKGPDQVNLVWTAVRGNQYGYLVEIRSAADPRYTQWTEFSPIPKTGGYTCDSTVALRGGSCTISDPEGVHVYNPPNNAVPYWVTEGSYTDPQDDSPAQFIAWGLKSGAAYDFRVRTYTGGAAPSSGPWSNVASATTSQATLRYVAPDGDDANDGTASDRSHAWHTLGHATGALRCGQELIVMGGDYAEDVVASQQPCTATSKIVVMVSPGATATLTSMAKAGAWHPILLQGNHIVIDGLRCISNTPHGDYDVEIDGSYNALLNVDVHPPVIPAGGNSAVLVRGSHNLIYRSSIHDYGSPDAAQNPSGNSGFILTFLGPNATDEVVWSNHLTRGGHDVTLCKGGCSYSRWLNNVMDGGWGMGIEALSADGQASGHNLIEGNIIKDVGKLVTFYKPAIEVSSPNNTVRRNLSFGSAYASLEESGFGGDAGHNLVYNNVFYAPASCIFQSAIGGAALYDDIVYANNICYKFTGLATDMYPGNRTGSITRNTIVGADAAGGLRQGDAVILWNRSAGAPFEYSKPLAYADESYSPPFSRNLDLAVDPRFVNEAAFDFHLAQGSPLIGAGTAVADKEWGTAAGSVDLGAFGIHVSGAAPPRRK